MKSVVFSLFLFVFGLMNAQNTLKKPIPLASLFDSIYTISNSYEGYKIIKKIHFQDLKRQSLDSLESYKQQLVEKEALLKLEMQNFESVKAQADLTQIALNQSLQKENNIDLFGAVMSKKKYNLILWSIVLLLLLGLCYYIYKFNNNKHLTKKAQNNLTEIEQELTAYRKRSLVNEQKLRRQLQDEINKQRNS